MNELLKEIWATSKRNKLRTALTGFAVAWGIFMLIFLLGAGNGLINAQLQQQDRHISNSMMVFSGQTSKAYGGLKEGRPIGLRESDLDITRTGFKNNVDKAGARVSRWGLTLSYGENYLSSPCYGVDPSYAEIEKVEMLDGRFVNAIDMKENRKVMVMSEDNAKEFAKDYRSLVGKYVKMDGMAFQIVGIYKSDESMRNNPVYAPFTTMKIIYGMGDEVGDLIFSFHGLTDMASSEKFEKEYRQKINLNHTAAPDDQEAIYLWNRFEQNLQMQTGIGIIQMALWIVGLFTLLSGVVGVSNIMLITVKERTHEFGIRKAIGAKPWSVLGLIMTESIIITTLFGYLGMVLGVIANEYMDATIGHDVIDTGVFKMTMFVNPTVGLDVCIEATAVIIIAGTIAGLIPAWKAARIRPIEALRAE